MSPEQRKNYFINVLTNSLKHSTSLDFDQVTLETCIDAVESDDGNKYPFNKYSVMIEDGKKILIMKRKDQMSDAIIQILPQDELLSVVSDAFLIDPQIDFNDLITILSTRYVLPSIQYKHYFAASKNDTSVSSMQCGLIEIGQKPDNNYNFVLFCVDSVTNYAYLRPLMTRNHNEIGIELLKLFLDVGIPCQLEVNIGYLFKSIFQYLSTKFNFITPPFIIHKKQFMYFRIKLLNEITMWIDKAKCGNWAVGLGYVQWLINNEVKVAHKNISNFSISTPYQAHFRIRPKLSSIISDSEEIYTYNEILCAVCNATSFKPINCDLCHRSVHSTCTRKALIKNDDLNIINVTCLSCAT